jgi:soluble lytic murein transglycosylase-like protein
MQIMPGTGRRLGCGDLYDPATNLACGARLVRRLVDRYAGRVDFALAAYALGARRADRAYRDGAAAPRQRFIRRVMAARGRWLEGCG